MRRRLGWIALFLGLTMVIVLQPHLERHWGLYLVTPARGTTARGERLFLDPFPDGIACQMEVQNLAFEGAPAVCHSWLTVTWGTSADRRLASDFTGANLLYSLYCRLRGIPAPASGAR
jgi:hypothetical protein